MNLALVVFHIQDEAGKPLSGVLASAVSTHGNWSSLTNACGDVVDPGTGMAGVNLTPGVYTVTFSKEGYTSIPLTATIENCGVIRQALPRAASVLPAPPTRDQLCGVKCQFQGLTVVTQQYGSLPWFEPALGWLDLQADREAVYDAKAAAGDTHINLALSGSYNEPNQAYERVQGRDYSSDMLSLRFLITEAICAGVARGIPNGFRILLAMAGDGMGPDPVGMTKGYDWLMQHFEPAWKSLRGDGTDDPDLTPWILPMPGYDGVVPGWQPWSCVNNYVRMARGVVGPTAALAIELAGGYNSWSGEANDWATADGQMFDVILSELPYQMGPPELIPANLLDGRDWKPMPPLTNEQRAPWDQVWQIVGALIPNFKRPADMPHNDYPQGIPYRLAGGTPRGPFFFNAFEFDTYGWVRWCPIAQVEKHRKALYDLGCQWVG